MDVKSVVELVAVAMLPLGFGAVIAQRMITGKSIGARIIQLSAVVMLIPVILILALERILDGATLGTLIGGIVGYLLSGIADYDRARGGDP